MWATPARLGAHATGVDAVHMGEGTWAFARYHALMLELARDAGRVRLGFTTTVDFVDRDGRLGEEATARSGLRLLLHDDPLVGHTTASYLESDRWAAVSWGEYALASDADDWLAALRPAAGGSGPTRVCQPDVRAFAEAAEELLRAYVDAVLERYVVAFGTR